MSISKIPTDICKSIISRLPVRSVLVCKCVSKKWLYLTSDPDFLQMHLDFHKQNSTCLMLSDIGDQGNKKGISSIGYHTLESLLLPENDNAVEEDDLSSKLSWIDGYAARMDYPFQDLGLTVDLFGSCNGCVCLWLQEEFFCLWNPATREYKRMSEAPKRYIYCEIKLYAFVYDPTTDDYKFVIAVSSEEETSLVHVYSLASDSWKSFLTPYSFLDEQNSGVLFNGDLHWLAFFQSNHSIVSLDIRNNRFKEIQPPSEHLELILVGVLEKRLCVLVESEFRAFDIWAMQVYEDPTSWIKRYSITHEIIIRRISYQPSFLRFMWSFKSGGILFTEWNEIVLYDPKHGSATERKLRYSVYENYSESLVSLNSGTYFEGRTVNGVYVELQILRKKNSVLQSRNAELESLNAQLVASNAEVQRNLQESQIAYQRLEQHVNAQRKALKAGAAMLTSLSESSINLEDESLTMQQRVEKEQAKRVPLSVGGALEPYQITEASKTPSTSKDS